MVDLKSPFTLGHSSGGAELAGSAAHQLGMGAPEVEELRRAGLLHDLGRVAVSSRIWEKPRAEHDREQIRLHACRAERILVRSPWPAGPTDREVEVLRLVACGRSNRQIADELVVSPRTAEHPVQHIYTKIGSSTRAAASLFAMEHGLLEH